MANQYPYAFSDLTCDCPDYTGKASGATTNALYASEYTTRDWSDSAYWQQLRTSYPSGVAFSCKHIYSAARDAIARGLMAPDSIPIPQDYITQSDPDGSSEIFNDPTQVNPTDPSKGDFVGFSWQLGAIAGANFS